jgi:hypothetical protein
MPTNGFIESTPSAPARRRNPPSFTCPDGPVVPPPPPPPPQAVATTARTTAIDASFFISSLP